MKPVQVQLLEALGAGVRPFDTGADTPPVPGDGFGVLLDDAMAGDPRTALGVRFAPGVSGVYGAQAQRDIARAVDKAAASGSGHALILHDRHTLRVDVRNRVVLGASELAHEAVITGIDAFVTLGGALEGGDGEIPEPDGLTIDAPARVVRNASLVHALAGRPTSV